MVIMIIIITTIMIIIIIIIILLPCKQKGSQKGSYGCKDQLLINRMAIENCHNKKRSLSTAWIDYRKAFDSVPHSWILKSLDIYSITCHHKFP